MDLDHSGTIDPHELSSVLWVLGEELHVQHNKETVSVEEPTWVNNDVKRIMGQAKENFEHYCALHGVEALPDEYHYPRAVDPNAHARINRKVDESVFERDGEDAQDGSTSKEHKRYLKIKERYGDAVSVGDDSLTKFFSTASRDVLKMSKKLVISGKVLGAFHESIEACPDDELHYAEFVHMLQSGQLNDMFPDHDWKSACKEIHLLRRAFDTADVDGDNSLEQGEFEMVVDTLHVGHDLSEEDLEYCWSVMIRSCLELNPEHPNQLSFTEFMIGVQQLKADKVIGGRLDFTKECPWSMLSLLVDTPVSKKEERRLTSELTYLERLGVHMVQKAQYPMHRDKVREVLKTCQEGKLRVLTDGKRERLDQVWWHCLIQATIIGFIACGISSPAENLFVYWFRNDGLVDIDCICYTRGCMFNPGSLGIADADLAPGDTTIPGAFVDAFKTSVTGPDPCETGYGVHEDGSVPYSCTFHDFSQAVVEHGEAVKEYCDVTACQPLPGGWNKEAPQVDPADGETPIHQPAWQVAQNCGARTNDTCGFHDAWSMGSYKLGVGQGDVPADECWTNVWAALWFWVTCLSVVAVCCAVEISLLMYYGVYHSMRIAWALGYRLAPLNEDRAFLADSLVRGAFELGNPENPILGVDPTAEVGKAGRWRIAMVILLWKGKIVLCAAVMKFIWGCVFPWHTAVWVKPWLSMPSDMFWNAMTAHIVISQATIRGVGVAAAHECFNEIMAAGAFKETTMSEIHKLQTARAVGVGIVKHGNLYPTMEVLLRHAISWMKMQTSAAVLVSEEDYKSRKHKVLDNPEAFLDDLPRLERNEKLAVLSVHLLCFVLDGDVNARTLAAWKAAIEVGPFAQYIRADQSTRLPLIDTSHSTEAHADMVCVVDRRAMRRTGSSTAGV